MPDDADRRNNGNLGHSKGVIAFDVESKSAVWLLPLAWPKYADPDASTTMPTPIYGQTYMCISISLDTAVDLASTMIDHQEPQVYLPHLPPALPKRSALYRLTQSIDPNAAASSIVTDYKSSKGMPFKVIAKNKKWNDDFWNDLVGPKLREDMDVETWIRGDVPAILDADGVHRTYDIKYIELSAAGCSVCVARDTGSCEMGHHEEEQLGCRRRCYQSDDHATQARRRRDCTARSKAVERFEVD